MLVLFAIACVDDPVLTRAPLLHRERVNAVQVEPPVELPRPSENGWVEVWVSAPVPLTVQDGGFVYPPGTVADRVELRQTARGERVIDVRGTTVDAEGNRWHHVFQPVSTEPDADLVGVRWPADDLDARAAAVDAFIASLEAHGRRHLDAVRSKLDCESCHQPDRPANTRPNEHGLVARGTDAAGFFTPSTLLADTVPAEAYGLPALPRPYVTWRCEQVVPAGTRRCPDGSLPVAHWDRDAAIRAGDPHALRVRTSLHQLLGETP